MGDRDAGNKRWEVVGDEPKVAGDEMMIGDNEVGDKAVGDKAAGDKVAGNQSDGRQGPNIPGSRGGSHGAARRD